MEDKQNKKQKDGAQRISVRPGNFTPPEAKGDAPKEGNAPAGHGRSRRSRGRRGGRDRKGREDRPAQENRAPREERPTPTPPPAAPAEKPERQGRHNRRGRRGGKGERGNAPEQNPSVRNEPTISATLQRELDEEFGTPTFSPVTGAASRKKTATDDLLDSEEFAVDIATASYLVEDVPCGFPTPDGKSLEVVGIRFRSAGRVYFFAPGEFQFKMGDRAIVDTARGPELGSIVMLKRRVAEKDVVQPLRPVLRPATPEDIAHDAENRAKEADALKVCERKIGVHKLDMTLVDAQYTFDNSKLLFYFTSEGRVDFRELVHDLAGHFHTRIELRQIGIRDEARLIGGLGMCGRPFCCSTYLSDFGQVSVKMAKEQGLSINASKISGCCGRLMCCLRYEHETYVAEAKLTPKKDTVVQTPDGRGTVVDGSPLAGTVRVRLAATPEEAPKTYHRDTLTVLGKSEKHAQGTQAAKQDAAAEKE